MSKLTWADVAHYYAKNEPRPRVYMEPHPIRKAALLECNTQYFLHKADADDLPELTDLPEITEDDARIVFGLIKGREWDAEQDGQGIEELFVTQGLGWIPSHANNLAMYPAAFHYLLSRNYNVFGIETWKEVQP